MSKVVYKAFPLWDWEKEAAWLNEMSRQGWQLCRVGWCRYEFEQGEPGRWQYQLEMLQKKRPRLPRLSGGHGHPGGRPAVQLGLSAA